VFHVWCLCWLQRNAPAGAATSSRTGMATTRRPTTSLMCRTCHSNQPRCASASVRGLAEWLAGSPLHLPVRCGLMQGVDNSSPPADDQTKCRGTHCPHQPFGQTLNKYRSRFLLVFRVPQLTSIQHTNQRTSQIRTGPGECGDRCFFELQCLTEFILDSEFHAGGCMLSEWRRSEAT